MIPTIRKYHVFNPIGKSIATDNIHYAEKKAILSNGTVFEDIRYQARKRLQRMYFRMSLNNTLPNEIDYPNLIN